jgi:hypothetical protein
MREINKAARLRQIQIAKNVFVVHDAESRERGADPVLLRVIKLLRADQVLLAFGTWREPLGAQVFITQSRGHAYA